MRLRFLEASKNIIEHLWTLQNWDSPYAVWLDEFGLSDYTPVQLKKIEIQQTDSERIIFGTIENEADCIPGAFTLGFDKLSDTPFANPVSILMNRAVQNTQDYMIEKYGQGTIAKGDLF